MPERVQLRCTKGWRKPANTVTVARPTEWGNPWRVGDERGWTVLPGGITDKTSPHPPLTAEQAVASFENARLADPWWIERIRTELAGKNLACWCPLDQPCHADVLLCIANEETDRG